LNVQAGLPAMDECVVEAENAASVLDCVMFYVLSSTPEIGLDIGLAEVKCKQFKFILLGLRLFVFCVVFELNCFECRAQVI